MPPNLTDHASLYETIDSEHDEVHGGERPQRQFESMQEYATPFNLNTGNVARGVVMYGKNLLSLFPFSFTGSASTTSLSRSHHIYKHPKSVRQNTHDNSTEE